LDYSFGDRFPVQLLKSVSLILIVQIEKKRFDVKDARAKWSCNGGEPVNTDLVEDMTRANRSRLEA